jgi:hypothetical protein
MRKVLTVMGKKGLKCEVQRRSVTQSSLIFFGICGIVGAPFLTAALLTIVSVLVQHESLQQRTRISEENKPLWLSLETGSSSHHPPS